MLFWIALTGVIIALAFGIVIFVGPPYLPTMRKQTDAALDMLDLKPGDTLLELGSGDGRVMLAAAKRGLKVVGIELNPFLIVVAWIVTFKYRSQVRFIWGSYWGAPWPRADAVFTFMLPRYMKRVDERMVKWRPDVPTKLASFAFAIPGREPIEKRDGVYLYEYK
jgi:SAM-dependent methyltransferase